MPCTNTFFLCLPVRHFAKSFQILLAPINLLLQELLKSNAQTSNDTKQGQKEESLTEARRADLINREVWLDWRSRWCLTHLCAGWRRGSSQSLLRNLKSSEAQNLSQTRSSGRRKSPPAWPPFIVKHLFPSQINFFSPPFNHPLFIHRGMTNSRVWQSKQFEFKTRTAPTVDKPVLPPAPFLFAVHTSKINSVHFPPLIPFHTSISNLKWSGTYGGLFGECIAYDLLNCQSLPKLHISASRPNFAQNLRQLWAWW